jgi:hypothetical protein
MVGGEHSRKELLEKLVTSYSEQLHMNAQPVDNARDNLLNFACFSLSSGSESGLCPWMQIRIPNPEN